MDRCKETVLGRLHTGAPRSLTRVRLRLHPGARCELPAPVFAGSGCLVARTSSRTQVEVGRVSGRSQGSGRRRPGEEAWKERTGAPASWNPGTPRRGPVPALCSPSDRPCLTSRRCSPDWNALAWLPGPGRGWRRVIKGPGERGGASGSERSQSGGVGAGTERVAGPAPRRQGAAEGCAAGGGECAGGGGARGFPACPGADLVERPRSRLPFPARPGVLAPPLAGTQVWSRAASNAELGRWRPGPVPPGGALPRAIGLPQQVASSTPGTDLPHCPRRSRKVCSDVSGGSTPRPAP